MGDLQLELTVALDDLGVVSWSVSGMPSFAEWASPLATAARMVVQARAPMLLLIGSEGRLFANSGGLALVGARCEGPVLGRPIVEVLPSYADLFAVALARAVRGEGTSFRDQELRCVRDGALTTAWFSLEFTPVQDASGFTLGVLCVASDVTHHVEKARELVVAGKQFELALGECEVVGTWSFDVLSDAITLGPNAMGILGQEKDSVCCVLLRGRFAEIVHPEDRGAFLRALRDAVDTRGVCRIRYRVRLADGRERRVIMLASPAFDRQGLLQRFVGVVIADMGETESALAESRFQFDTLTESLPQIVWSSDAEGRHDYFSRRWTEFTGIEPHDITENTWKELVYPEDWLRVCRAWNDARESGQPYDIDYRFLNCSGEYRWLRVMAMPVRDDSGAIIRWCGTSTDVHEAYLLSEERQRLAYELERIANWDQLTGVLTRRAFFERSAAAMAQAASQRQPVGVMMMDVDHFKQINDGYGHPAGDAVLSLTAKRIDGVIKDCDLLGRLGGEEFALLIAGCSSGGAMEIAERIRSAVAAEPFAIPSGERIWVTLSIGVTSAGARGGDLERLLSIADKALYQAKSGGRNRSALVDA